MDDNVINPELLAPSISDVIGKNFETASSNEEKILAIREILSSVENMRNDLNTIAQSMENKYVATFKAQIEGLFSDFNWNVNYTVKTYDHPKFIGCCKSVLASIMKILGRRNGGLLLVDMHFKMCLKIINELTKNIQENGSALNDPVLLQVLIKGFLSSVKVLKRYWYVIIPCKKKCSIMLCLNQSFKTLKFLRKIIDKRLSHLVIYLLNRLKECCNKLHELLFKCEDQFQTSEFIILMDSCLYKLDQLSYEHNVEDDDFVQVKSKTVSSLKPLLDELLCLAMTICHISDREIDCNSIKAYSQKVLDEFQKINEIYTCNMKSDAERLGLILCQLEDTVNTAVLNVVLDIFIGINNPLRELVNRCSDQVEISDSKTVGDLENEISTFDKHMDKILHVGLFAVSCSTDVKKILHIRSCLASLESLQGELITSLVSLYLRPNDETKTTFQYLFKNWIEEITQFKNLMYLILDPTAFCRVVKKRIKYLIFRLNENELPSVLKIRSNLSLILSYTKKLIKTLRNGLDREEVITNRVVELLERLQLAYQECEASISLLDLQLSVEEMLSRIVKRVNLIIGAIDNLIKGINDSENESLESEGDEIENFDDQKLDVYKLNVISSEQQNSTGKDPLTPYINKGKLRTKERVVLYNTPRNSHHIQDIPARSDSLIRLELTPGRRSSPRRGCCRPLTTNLELENSLDFELTLLLDNITDLNTTFSNTFTSNEEGQNVEDNKEENVSKAELANSGNTDNEKVFLGTEMRRKLDQSLNQLSSSDLLSIHKESNCEFQTPDRMHDLTLVQQKIDFLMEQIND